MNTKADIGVVGLAVMGANIALNLADSGNNVAVYNRTKSVTDEFMAGEAADKAIVPCSDLAELVDNLA